MKIAAIICEFNPIHTGHKRLIDYAKTIAEKVVCVMSGNFVQRGMPACADKYDRARHAILCGADIVVELPTVFATSSAEDFALGGVKIANQLGADCLVFGSECGDIEKLQEIANLLDDETINEKIQTYLSQGNSYPKAVSLAVNSDILQSPNNTLAIEYIRAIKKIGSKIKQITIKREDNYHGEGVEYASSTALRKDITLRNKFTFDFVETDIDDTIEEKFCQFACHHLAIMDSQALSKIDGVAEGLNNKIYKADKHLGYDTLVEQIKSKRYTRAKIQRIILRSILGIEEFDMRLAREGEIQTKVLAVRTSAVELLQRCNDQLDDSFTVTADKLYLSFSGKKAPTKLQKID